MEDRIQRLRAQCRRRAKKRSDQVIADVCALEDMVIDRKESSLILGVCSYELARVFPVLFCDSTDEKWFCKTWTLEPDEERAVDEQIRFGLAVGRADHYACRGS